MKTQQSKDDYKRFIAPSFTEFLPRCEAHHYFRSKSKRGRALNTKKDALVFDNSDERILKSFFRNKNGTYRRFWDLSYRNRDFFFKICRNFKVSRISILAELGNRISIYGEQENKEY